MRSEELRVINPKLLTPNTAYLSNQRELITQCHCQWSVLQLYQTLCEQRSKLHKASGRVAQMLQSQEL